MGLKNIMEMTPEEAEAFIRSYKPLVYPMKNIKIDWKAISRPVNAYTGVPRIKRRRRKKKK